MRGGGGIKLTSADDANNAGGAVVSKDGRYIYYSVRPRSFNYIPNLSNGLWQIVRFDRVTSQTLPVTSGYGGAARPAISPNGKVLLYTSRRDDDTVLIARDLDSGAERILAQPVTRDEQEGFAQMDLWPNYAFTPDGAAVIFSDRGKLVRVEVSNGARHEIPFTAHVDQSLAPLVTWQEKTEQGPVRARIIRWPSESQNNKFVAFEAFGRIWLQSLAAGKPAGAPRRLTADNQRAPPREYAPDISPDGQWIAFVSWSDSEAGQVWKVRAQPGSTPVRLTTRRVIMPIPLGRPTSATSLSAVARDWNCAVDSPRTKSTSRWPWSPHQAATCNRWWRSSRAKPTSSIPKRFGAPTARGCCT